MPCSEFTGYSDHAAFSDRFIGGIRKESLLTREEVANSRKHVTRGMMPHPLNRRGRQSDYAVNCVEISREIRYTP